MTKRSRTTRKGSSRRAAPPAGGPVPRNAGILLLAVLATTDGIFDALAGYAALDNASGSTGLLSGGLLTGVGYALLVVGALLVVLAFGLAMVRPWAWRFGLVVEAANLALALVRLAGGRPAIVGVLLTLLLASTVLYYLLQRPVRAMFGHA